MRGSALALALLTLIAGDLQVRAQEAGGGPPCWGFCQLWMGGGAAPEAPPPAVEGRRHRHRWGSFRTVRAYREPRPIFAEREVDDPVERPHTPWRPRYPAARMAAARPATLPIARPQALPVVTPAVAGPASAQPKIVHATAAGTVPPPLATPRPAAEVTAAPLE